MRDDYQFSYATDSGVFKNLSGTVSEGFTGNLIGLYATTVNDIVPQ